MPTKILGLGNVILDLTLPVDEQYLKQRDLPLNSQIICKTKAHQQILKSVVENKNSVLTTGGCCANTLKFMDHLQKNRDKIKSLSSPLATSTLNTEPRRLFNTTFIGRIGDPSFCKNSKIYKSKIKNCMDNIHLIASTENLPTGIAAGLTFKENRCLLADLGAVEEGIKNFNLIEKIGVDLKNFDIFYVPGMFLGSSGVQVLEKIFNVTSVDSFLTVMADNEADTELQSRTTPPSPSPSTNNKPILAINLSATYLLDNEELRQVLNRAVSFSDIIFGNSEEFEKAKSFGFDFQNKLVVVTNGADPVWIIYNNNTKTLPMATKISVQGDTVAAGDGFVSGFLYKFIELDLLSSINWASEDCPYNFNEIEKCVILGNQVAAKIIQNAGAAI